MARGHENLIPFNKRSEDEARELGRKGGKASGEARRKKADFRKTLNALLTTEIDSPEWTPVLEALGLESTLESALNMAMIKEGLAGNVKAYEAIAKYSGQSEKTDTDQEEQNLRMAASKAKMGVDDEGEAEDDGFLDALNGSAGTDWGDWEEDEDEEEETDI
ncbi:KGG domain-containing protein [Lacrimispora sp.]|uniref:KGG domain-containing protein n=1 Tax=Lacrimispora sp. TaxID=2719234 RepID=UPI002FDA4157